jgi:hypothetical protein
MENSKLKAALVEKIQEWADENCESNWPYVIVHDDFTEDMANSAFAVFQAMAKSQQYCIKAGYFEKV